MLDHRVDDLAQMDRGSIDRTVKEILHRDQAVSGVQMRESKHLVIEASQMQAQELRCALRIR